MLLLWALTRVGHNDPPALLWITQRAATQVLDNGHTIKYLAHSICVCVCGGVHMNLLSGA